jgi:hypothetical protein
MNKLVNLETIIMKRKILLAGFLILVVLLSSCGSKTTTTTSDTIIETTMSPETELVLGTLKLEGTDQAVNSEQAAKLLLLWKMYKSLSTGDTTAQEEVDAVLKQIYAAMTEDQLSAIDAMHLKPEDMVTIMQDLGLAMVPVGNKAGATPDISQMQADFQDSGDPSAGFTGGGPGGGGSGGRPSGGGPPAGFTGDMSQEGETGALPGMGIDGTSTTPQAWQTGRTGGGSMLINRLVSALIDYLNTKIQP